MNGTGVCRISDEGLVEVLLTVKHATGGASDIKLLNIRRALISAISTSRFAAYEGYAYDSIHRAFDLGEVAGTVKVVLLEHAVPYITVPPVTLKMFATGSTRADKPDMEAATIARGVRTGDDNQADAFFLACVARAYALGGARLRHELEAIHSLKHPRPKTTKRVRRLVKNAI